jgi:hypothetical protein
MNLYKSLLPVFLLACMFFLSACSYETKTYNFETSELNLVAEGPLFEGSNTATAIWKINPSIFFESQNPRDLKFTSGKVKRIVISSDSYADLPEIDQMVVEIAAPETPMMRLGILEQNTKAGESYELQLAENQEDLHKFFHQNEITFVADVNMLDEEYYDNISLNILVEFEFQTKE